MLKRLFLLTLFALTPVAWAAGDSGTAGPAPDAALRQPPTPVRAVLELFTSQGCSSCPPADKLLKTYVAQKDIMALSLPVDYWDYIGWKDTLASPKNAQRQRAYAANVTNGPIYTPQIVVNGRADALGSSQNQIEYAMSITADAFQKNRIPVQSWHNENTIMIQIGAGAVTEKNAQATIWLAKVQKKASVEIKAGENRGRSLEYFNVVREMIPVGTWNGRAMNIRLDRKAIQFPETEDGAILMQTDAYGPIIGAAWLGG